MAADFVTFQAKYAHQTYTVAWFFCTQISTKAGWLQPIRFDNTQHIWFDALQGVQGS